MKAYAVPPEVVAQLPPQVWRYVNDAVDRVGMAVSVQFDVYTGAAVLWIALDDDNHIFGAAVTQIEEETATKDRLLVIVAYGADDHEQVSELMPRLDEYGRAEGCVRMRIYGRPGWQRKLPDFEVKAVIMDKEL